MQAHHVVGPVRVPASVAMSVVMLLRLDVYRGRGAHHDHAY